jgi:hypothetical protein
MRFQAFSFYQKVTVLQNVLVVGARALGNAAVVTLVDKVELSYSYTEESKSLTV